MTKHILVMVLIALTFNTVAQAQEEKKHEIGIGYGILPNTHIISAYADVFGLFVGRTPENETYGGPVSAEYFYRLNKHIRLGGVATYTTHKEDVFYMKERDGELKHNFITVMPAAKLYWFDKKSWGMYSKLGAGITYSNAKETGTDSNGNHIEDTDNEIFFNFQASLVGVEVGNESVRGFAELGVGEQGMALIGVRYKF